MSDVLVIGGTGLISTGVVRQLVAAGHDVTTFTRGERDAELPSSVTHEIGTGMTTRASPNSRQTSRPMSSLTSSASRPSRPRVLLRRSAA